MSWDEILPGEGGGVRSRLGEIFPTLIGSFECDKCGSRCEAGNAYDPHDGAFHQGPGGERPAWICTNDDCGAKFRRESDSVTFDPWE